MRWEDGEGGRVVRWQGGKGGKVVRWQGGKDETKVGGTWFYSRIGDTR